MTPSLSQIAADVRRLAPEHWPSGLDFDKQGVVICDAHVLTRLVDNDAVARLALIGAMVLACRLELLLAGWIVDGPGGCKEFHDHNHSNDLLLSLHAAFLWAKGAAATTTTTM